MLLSAISTARSMLQSWISDFTPILVKRANANLLTTNTLFSETFKTKSRILLSSGETVKMVLNSVVLSIIDPSVYAFPYAIVLTVLALIVFTLFFKFPSLRRYRKKRNLLIYGAIALVAVLLVFQAHDVAIGPTHISYMFDCGTGEFSSGRTNQFNVTCSNSGFRTANFYIVLQSVNASFTAQNPEDYIQVNSTTLKIPFSFQELNRATESKPVFFEIDQNATGFSFSACVEAQSGSSLIVITCMPTLVGCWNSTSNCYTINDWSIMTI